MVRKISKNVMPYKATKRFMSVTKNGNYRAAVRTLRLALIRLYSDQCGWLSAYGGMKAHPLLIHKAPILKDSDIRCKEYDPDVLQFAHVHGKETKLSGPGRGSYERLKDVFDHPDCYVLLCEDHHREYDKSK